MIPFRNDFVDPLVRGFLEPISAKTTPPIIALKPPSIQAIKKRNELPVFWATMDGVRVIPIPITELPTAIVISQKLSFGFIDIYSTLIN